MLHPESRGGNGTGVLPFDLNAGRNFGNLEREVCRNFRACYHSERAKNLLAKPGAVTVI